MQLFSTLYERALTWARHPHAERYLAGLSFAESSFFPVPPDVMLGPMVLARNELAWRYAFVTTLFSVLGGILGYVLGLYAFHLIEPLIQGNRYGDYYTQASALFAEYGIWIVFIAGFAPIPYKIFTLSAGALGMAFMPFVLVSILGRGARFYLVSYVIRLGGAQFENVLRKNIELAGWLLVILVLLYLGISEFYF